MNDTDKNSICVSIPPNIDEYVQRILQDNKIVILSATWCPGCTSLKNVLKSVSAEFHALEIDVLDAQFKNFGRSVFYTLNAKTDQNSIPQLFIKSVHIPTNVFNVLYSVYNGILMDVIEEVIPLECDFGVIIIGGGSGGISAAKELTNSGRSVLLCNFVEKSPQGSTWGLGGTCVNVGCIPKMLMHTSGNISKNIHNAVCYGWRIDTNFEFQWNVLVENIQNYIHSLNWKYQKLLASQNIQFKNATARFLNTHTVELRNSDGNIETITGQNIIIATGTRPLLLEFPGVEYCSTSDDIFSMSNAPGTTLVIGASYVGLECACFLNQFGYEVSIMTRSTPLNKHEFDETVVEKLIQILTKAGIKFIMNCRPTKIILDTNNMKKVEGKYSDNSHFEYKYSTVILATGRETRIKDLIQAINLKCSNGKIIVDDFDATSARCIFALGDVVANRPALTTLAVAAGKQLGKRLSNVDNPLKFKVDYDFVPRTVFTSPEYSAIGESEKSAKIKYNSVVVYSGRFRPTRNEMIADLLNDGYIKIICTVEKDKSEDESRNLGRHFDIPENSTKLEKVVGIHLLSTHSSEIIQGFVLCIKLGISKHDLDHFIYSHTLGSEIFSNLILTKKNSNDNLENKVFCNYSV